MPLLRKLKQPLEVYVVQLSDHSKEAVKDATHHLTDAIDWVKAQVSDSEEQENIEQWMRARASEALSGPKPRKPRVHAEAGLMALSSYVKQTSQGSISYVPRGLLPAFDDVRTFVPMNVS